MNRTLADQKIADLQRRLDRLAEEVFRRVPAVRTPPSGLGGGGAKLKFAKIVARFTAANTAWTDHATDGFPSHCTAHLVESGGGNESENTLYLMCHDGATGHEVGVIPDVDAIVTWFSGDGKLNVPGTDPAVKFDGFIVPGILGAKLRLCDPAALLYQAPYSDGTKYVHDDARVIDRP